MIGLGQGFRVQRFPDVIGIQGIIRFLKSILEAFYERSVGFVISNLNPGTSLEAVREWLFFTISASG